MGITAASVFGDEEIKKLAEQFTPFRVLEMKEEVRYLLIRVLDAKGVDHKIFLEAETTTQK